MYTPFAVANMTVADGSSASRNRAASAGGVLHCAPGLAALEVTGGSTVDGNLAAAGCVTDGLRGLMGALSPLLICDPDP